MSADPVKTTTLRLRRVRFKDGRTIEVLRPKPTGAIRWAEIQRMLSEVRQTHGEDVSGFAFVIWGKDAGSTAAAQSDGHIPAIYLPDFVRNRLLARQIESWTIDTVNGQ